MSADDGFGFGTGKQDGASGLGKKWLIIGLITLMGPALALYSFFKSKPFRKSKRKPKPGRKTRDDEDD
jgi:hypothetical protein